MSPTDLIGRWFLDVDRRHWDGVRAALAEEVDIDYTFWRASRTA